MPQKPASSEQSNRHITVDKKKMSDDDTDHSLVVRFIAAVDELDGMYQLLIVFSIFVGLGFIGFGLPLLGIVWLVGGPAFVFAVQRWED